MKKAYLFINILFVCCNAIAQGQDSLMQPGDASEAYHEYRLMLTTPPYALEKITDLISKLKRSGEYMGGTKALDETTYSSLSLREKFTYNMIQPETYSQNCSGMPFIKNEHKKIFAQLPNAFGENSWRLKQIEFFLENRDSVIALMKECIINQKRFGLNFKHVIVAINAVEMIPFIIATYNADKQEHDLLTLLMLLMKDNKYGAFRRSASYKKLYADTNYYTSYKASLDYGVSSEAMIIKLAAEFYNGLPK